MMAVIFPYAQNTVWDCEESYLIPISAVCALFGWSPKNASLPLKGALASGWYYTKMGLNVH